MKLVKDWFAVPHGGIYPKMYPAGTVLAGVDLERAKALGLVEAEPEPAFARKAKGKA